MSLDTAFGRGSEMTPDEVDRVVRRSMEALVVTQKGHRALYGAGSSPRKSGDPTGRSIMQADREAHAARVET